MNWNAPKVYAVKHKDLDIRMESRSGGIFTALSDKILEDGGVVYGCVLNESFMAMHFRAVTKEDRDRMRGSKYIQSNMGNTFRDVSSDLKEGKQVLFSGTSCQIAGLRGFLGKEFNNLVCVDIVCHGVPSPKVWDEYLKWQEKRNKGKVIGVDFRNKKKYGWNSHVETLRIDIGEGKHKDIHSEVFKTLFFNFALRACCYECPYKSIMHPGDITIADYWGIDKAAPDFNDNKGVSLVLVNNNKGEAVFGTTRSFLELRECSIENSMQPALKQPSSRSKKSERFWHDFHNSPIEIVAKRYGNHGTINKVKKLLKNIKRKINKH